MSWSLTRDIGELVATAGDYLANRPVEHTALLTEVDFLARHPDPQAEQRYGWWTSPSGEVAGAFVQGPRHPALLSLVPDEALDALPAALPDVGRFGVDERYVERAAAAWRQVGVDLVPVGGVRLHRLVDGELPEVSFAGAPRMATRSDRHLLVDWFRRFKAAHPEDPSDLAFVVDDALEDGAILMWEVHGDAVAMASRTPVTAGMTRLGLVFSPTDDAAAEQAVFIAMCRDARERADDVLVFGPHDEVSQHRHADLGFEPILERVMLGTQGP